MLCLVESLDVLFASQLPIGQGQLRLGIEIIEIYIENRMQSCQGSKQKDRD